MLRRKPLCLKEMPCHIRTYTPDRWFNAEIACSVGLTAAAVYDCVSYSITCMRREPFSVGGLHVDASDTIWWHDCEGQLAKRLPMITPAGIRAALNNLATTGWLQMKREYEGQRKKTWYALPSNAYQ
jgi:hypothetical protein